jgi:hypothetical protein
MDAKELRFAVSARAPKTPQSLSTCRIRKANRPYRTNSVAVRKKDASVSMDLETATRMRRKTVRQTSAIEHPPLAAPP